MKADETAADGTRGALIVTGADAPLGAAVVAAACQTGRSVIACGSDHVALGEVASRDVVSLTLASSDPDQLRVVLAVAIDRFGGVAGVVHAEGHGYAPRTAGEVGGRLVGVQALVDALPPSTPHVIAVEESGRSSDPVAPLRAAAAAALSAWARSAAGMVRVVWVPAAAEPRAWTTPLLRALHAGGLRNRVADSARRLVRLRG